MRSSVGDAFKELSLELSKVQGEIEKVEREIGRVATKIENGEHLSPDEKSYWMQKEMQLRDEKKLLIQKEMQLRDKEKYLREEEKQLRDKEMPLMHSTSREGGRPPLHPFSFPSPAHDEISTAEIRQALDEILLATKKTDRATPQYSPALLASREIARLKNDGYFRNLPEKAGEESVLSEDEAEELRTMKNEHQVVAFVTSRLEKAIPEGMCVFNSEAYKWVQTACPGEESIYNEKPDMIICHPAFIERKVPFNCKDDQKLAQLRREGDKYGVLSHWRLRDFIGLTCEAKQAIDNAGFGQVINYGRHLCFGNHPADVTKLLLFDKEEFWLVESVKGTVSRVKICAWSTPGSKAYLHDFVRQPMLSKLLQKACRHFNLSLDDSIGTRSFLGAGGFGFVFSAIREDGRKIALKLALRRPGNDSPHLRLESERGRMIRAKELCPSEVIGVEDSGYALFDEGAALLLSEVGEDYSKLSPQVIFDSLKSLHNCGVLHGDARLQNVVCVNGKPRWIDFAQADFNVPESFKHELQTLKNELEKQYHGFQAK